MKRLLLSFTIFMAAFAIVACSKDKGDGQAPGYHNNGVYGSHPNAYGNCYGQNNYGGAYQGNCHGNNGFYGGGYMGGYGGPHTAGSCDLRFAGQTQLCPPGYQCQPAGIYGICVRSYFY